MHTVQTVYSAIEKKNSQLSAGQLDDILATLEDLEKRYGAEYFNHETTLGNVVRLVATKFIIIRGVLEDIIVENLHGDIEVLHWALENQKVVIKKIDWLKNLQAQFPEYPQTHLPIMIERVVALACIHPTPESRQVIMADGTIGDLILADPKNLYYLMTKKEKDENKN